MIRLNYHTPGTAPGTLIPVAAATDAPPLLTLIQYDAETIFEGEFDTLDELLARFDPAKVNWINIDGLNDATLLKRLGARFELHPLALEDVLNTTQRPKVELNKGHFFIVSEMLYFGEDEQLTFEQVSMFLGDSYVITLQEERGKDAFDHVRKRLRSGRGYARTRKADYLAYAQLDGIIDHYFPVLESIGDSIEELEEDLLEKPNKNTLRELYAVKRLLLQVRRACWPQREVLNTLMRDDTGRIEQETQIFLRDCYDHITQIIDIVESYRDLTAGLMDLYLSSVGVRTNDIMRVLTVVSTVFIPLTFLAGVYGMNFNTESPFNMPELNWRFGYLFFWTVSAIVAVTTYIIVKRKKWL